MTTEPNLALQIASLFNNKTPDKTKADNETNVSENASQRTLQLIPLR